ncbi:MAG: hypothetical protein KKC80_07065, partial [Candidatus Margulisbacteria bacterium]|nr:hypothetical protein [Candidatus Margulisiibacteriota bacterium]MBU1616950.1 hypothetical protein [Candidatus Margulisiibacteriota bacterium]
MPAFIGTTRKSGNILVAGRTLTPPEYRAVAPYLGMSLDRRIKMATRDASFRSLQTRLQNRETSPLAYFIFNTPCNQACDFCFFDPGDPSTSKIDWEAAKGKIIQAKKDGFQVKIYPKEFNYNDQVFGHSLELMDLAGETFAITNGIKGFRPSHLTALAHSSLRQLVVSFLPRGKHATHGRDRYNAVERTIRGLAEFSRQGLTRPFTVGLFCQVDPQDPAIVLEAAEAAVNLGVDTLNFRLTLPLGNARLDNRVVTGEDFDRVLLAFIDARIRWPKETIKLLLSSATFGPNYYSKGMFRYQLGLDRDPYFASKYPCPMIDRPESFSLLLPQERRVFCPTLVSQAPLESSPLPDFCQPCDVLEICRGGCAAR